MHIDQQIVKDALQGAAVGTHGEAIVTTDGGETWTRRSSGLDRMLSDLVWLDTGRALVLHEVESPLLAEVLAWYGGNQSKAAAALGINRATLRKKLHQYGLTD